MIRKLQILIYLLFSFYANAQRQADAILVGNSFFSAPGVPPSSNSVLTFDDTSFINENTSTAIVTSNFYSCANFADKNGNLIFASNGWRLLNSYGEVLSYKLWSDDVDWPGGSPDTTRVDLMRGPLFLPDPADSNRVYLFYGEYKQNLPIPTLFYANQDIRFCYALLDVPTQSLISKGHIILEDTTALSDMVALRHGNGRDWWIYKSSLKSNQYYRGLLSTAGLSAFELITVPGLSGRDQAYTFTHFTRDGSMMAHFSTYASKYCQRMDVNRCTGELSNPRETDLNPMFRAAEVGNFILSPDGSKFYGYRLNYNDSTYLRGNYQYDFDLDSLTFLTPQGTLLFMSPNFKELYFSTRIDEPDSTFRYLGAIQNPDSLGLLANVNETKYPIVNAPVMLASANFANYRLGPLQGSACDTIGTVSLGPKVEQALAELTVFPNPSNELLHVRLQQRKSAPAQLYLYNAVGQLVYSQAVETEYTKLDVIDVGLIPGVYTVHVQTGKQRLVKKWVLSNHNVSPSGF
jgi:hypothetical protein